MSEEPRIATRLDGSRHMLAWPITAVLVPLVLLVSAVGLLRPSIYRETAWVVPQNRGQDLVTIIAGIALIGTLARARSGSLRAIIVWSGLLAYIWYTYIGASFAYRFNGLFLVYVACMSLSRAALIALFGGLDVVRLRSSFLQAAPARAAAAFLLVMAFILSSLWISQVIAYLLSGELPELIVRAETPTNFVFVLDLGVVVPLSVLAAVFLLRDLPWGYALAGALLMKTATMGFALLSMTTFAAMAGQPVDLAARRFLVPSGCCRLCDDDLVHFFMPLMT